ncbi:MAG TPA: hypothetical protein VGI48_09530 [Caldimonas sp.]|jgi:hypothetical protein
MDATDEPGTGRAPCFSERFKRRLLNQLAQRMAAKHCQHLRVMLQGQLDAAEMYGRELELLSAWQHFLIQGGPVQTSEHWK